MYSRASWAPMPSRVVNTMGRKARPSPTQPARCFSFRRDVFLFGGPRDEERVGRGGGGGDVGRHEGA
eukprot:scaffold9229_cov64-Phaeocystis_antarctica.AAC.2